MLEATWANGFREKYNPGFLKIGIRSVAPLGLGVWGGDVQVVAAGSRGLVVRIGSGGFSGDYGVQLYALNGSLISEADDLHIESGTSTIEQEFFVDHVGVYLVVVNYNGSTVKRIKTVVQ